MGVITNGSGGGGGNVRYNPDNDMVEIKYNGTWTPWKQAFMTFDGTIYDSGDWGVAYANPGDYYHNSTPIVGGLILNENNIGGAWGSATSIRLCGIDEAIDLTPYSRLICNYTVNGTAGVVTVDVSSYSSSAYIYLNCGHGTTNYGCQLQLSTSKNLSDWFTQGIIYSSSSSANIAVTKIWLE